MKFHKLLLVIATIFLVSCISDVDFDQVDDVEINTSHLISLVYFTADTNYFLDDLENETLFISDTTELPIFAGPYNENYLIQADFQFLINNTFDRRAEFQIEFLDEEDQNTFTFNNMIIGPNTVFEQIQVINEAMIPSVLPSKKVVISILLDAGSIPLDPSQNMDIEYQSAATLHYQITADEE